MEIIHRNFMTILNEKDKNARMKEDIRTMQSKEEGKKNIKTTEL